MSSATCTQTLPADSSRADSPSTAARLRRALALGKPCRKAALLVVVLTMAASAASAVEPLFFKLIFDQLERGGRWQAAAVGVGGLAALGIAREILGGASQWLTWRTRLRIHYTLLEATVDRLHRLPFSFHRSEGVGAVMTRLERGIQGFVGALTEMAFNVLPALVYLVLGVALMLKLDWRLALLVLAFAPLPAWLAARAAPVQVKRERDLLERWARIYARFHEVLSGLLTVRSFAMEDAEKHRFLRGVDAANQKVERGVGFDTRVGVAQNVVMLLARVAALLAGSIMVARGETTVGTLVAFLGYIGGVFGPVQGLLGVYRTLRTASVSIDQVLAIMDAQPHVVDAPGAVALESVRGEVRFEKLSFGYAPDQPPVLNDLELTVAPGETLAIVGPSGSGKSTLMALLQRLYDPSAGRITIDGQDLRQLTQHSLRRQIGIVLQEPMLFNDTVRQNIAYGRPDASLEQVEAAARAAHAEPFIERLPQGYDTVLGERGALLSVGERQRIAIARALLKDPPLLILDEATSALDAETETEVQAALEQLMEHRTSFVIAHRLATVVRADRIVVLRHGRIVEVGGHRELMRSGGYYAQLVERQSAGLLSVDGPAAVGA